MSQPEQEGLLLQFKSPCRNFSLVFDDDGKVAYAYLREGNRIVGDLWLYNRGSTPEQPEWPDKSKLPFANPKEYVAEQGTVVRSVSATDISVTWAYEQDEAVAHIFLFGALCGIVGPGDRPGFARFAAKDGPLARAMHTENP